MVDQVKHDETVASLARIQEFDVSSLARKSELGNLNFEPAVPLARRLVEFFKKIPQPMLHDLPENSLNEILTQANSTYALFSQVLDFKLEQGNPGEARQSIIQNLDNHYGRVFVPLHSWVSYGTSRTVDFNNLASEGRAAVQTIEDLGARLNQQFEEREARANQLEEQLRASLARQGVGTQAQYFELEAKNHGDEAGKWARRTIQWAAIVSVLAVASFFTYRIPGIAPQNTAEAIQLVASKLVLFGAVTFMLVRSSRNYMAHKHNEVVNRHKQNSLLTFNALVEASSTPEARNTVLNHAAASIYAVPETGYVRASGDASPNITTLVELLPRMQTRVE